MGKLLQHRELNSGEALLEGRGFLLPLRLIQPLMSRQLNDHEKGIEVSVPRKDSPERNNEGNAK